MSVFKPETMGLRAEGAPSIELKLCSDAVTQGASWSPKTEPETQEDWDLLNRTNELARARWNIGGDSPHLPPAPLAGGCAYHYCWMPVADKDDFCAAHGGKDAPLPPWPRELQKLRTDGATIASKLNLGEDDKS